jgi:hypothetical protein
MSSKCLLTDLSATAAAITGVADRDALLPMRTGAEMRGRATRGVKEEVSGVETRPLLNDFGRSAAFMVREFVVGTGTDWGKDGTGTRQNSRQNSPACTAAPGVSLRLWVVSMHPTVHLHILHQTKIRVFPPVSPIPYPLPLISQRLSVPQSILPQRASTMSQLNEGLPIDRLTVLCTSHIHVRNSEPEPTFGGRSLDEGGGGEGGEEGFIIMVLDRAEYMHISIAGFVTQ